MDRKEIFKYAKDYYGTLPEYLFEKNPDTAVLRNESSGKWYAAVMSVKKQTLGLKGEGTAEIMNVKCDPLLVGSLRLQKGFLPAYHMNKNSWISIIIDIVPEEMIINLLNMSYGLTRK